MRFFFLFLFSMLLLSCGPNAKEVAEAQQRKEDSIRVVTRRQVELIQILKDSIASTNVINEALENRMMLMQANIVVEKDKLNRIGEFQFMRTASERETQIRNQVIVIEQMQKEAGNIKREIVINRETAARVSRRLTIAQREL